VNGGLVFAAAKVAKLWSAEKFLFGHIENKLIFQEPQPYHSQKLKYGMNFEIYLQAFKVCNEDKFLPEAKALYLDLCLKKKRSPEWDSSMLPMFTEFLKGKSFYYVGRSLKGGFWRYWNTLKSSNSSDGCIRLCATERSRYYASACG
jgi:hypothetical protein